MEGAIKLNFFQMISAYVFVVILLAIVNRRGIKREREILVSCIRMTIQLIMTGYILVFVFRNPNPFITMLILIIMELFSIQNIYKRSKEKLSNKLKKIIAFSMIIGTVSSLFYFLVIVIGISPWFNPRYFIPIAGMIIGNSMTGISLGVSKLTDGIKKQRNEIEMALMLGATPKYAIKAIIDSTFDSAILPTINSMVGMGIVFLPGMMTGQILSGTSPLIAIEYQIAIMLGILGSVSITVIIFLKLATSVFFNEKAQFIYD